jgi:16S rRNA (adenine1518-N6/adenine1519-N6)-dimethyltransferase
MQLIELAIDPNLRPENLCLNEYIKLANFIVDNPPLLAINKTSKRKVKNKKLPNNTLSDG